MIFARSAGYLSGTLGASFLGNFDKSFLISFATISSGILTIFFPYSTKMWQLALLGYLADIGMGIFDVFANISVLRLWRENKKVQSTVLHLSHGFFATGSFMKAFEIYEFFNFIC